MKTTELIYATNKLDNDFSIKEPLVLFRIYYSQLGSSLYWLWKKEVKRKLKFSFSLEHSYVKLVVIVKPLKEFHFRLNWLW